MVFNTKTKRVSKDTQTAATKHAQREALKNGKKLSGCTPERTKIRQSLASSPTLRGSPGRGSPCKGHMAGRGRQLVGLNDSRDGENIDYGKEKVEGPPSSRRIVSPWMYGGNVLRAPAAPVLTLPRGWTSRSGRFRPTESGLGFDARSTGANNGNTVTSGKSGTMTRGNAFQEDLEIEMKDPAKREEFYKDLEEKGIKAVIIVDDEWDARSNFSTVSLSDTSYILDLAQQKESRDKQRQEEALEEAFDLYKTALAEGAKDDEAMFFMLLKEVRKELDEKYKELDRRCDELLDEALEAELERREKEKNKSAHSVFSYEEEEALLNLGKSTHIFDEIIATSQKGKMDNFTEMEDIDPSKYDVDPHGQFEHGIDMQNGNHDKIPKIREGKGFFGCCGQGVEDSVVISKKSPDASLFRRLRKKQAEERKKDATLTEDDMWWEKEPIKITVPEVEEDKPSPDIPSRSAHSNRSWLTSSLRSLTGRNGEKEQNDNLWSRFQNSFCREHISGNDNGKEGESSDRRKGLSSLKSPRRTMSMTEKTSNGKRSPNRSDSSFSPRRSKSMKAKAPDSDKDSKNIIGNSSPKPARRRKSKKGPGTNTENNGTRQLSKSPKRKKRATQENCLEELDAADINGVKKATPKKKTKKKKKKGDKNKSKKNANTNKMRVKKNKVKENLEDVPSLESDSEYDLDDTSGSGQLTDDCTQSVRSNNNEQKRENRSVDSSDEDGGKGKELKKRKKNKTQKSEEEASILKADRKTKDSYEADNFDSKKPKKKKSILDQ